MASANETGAHAPKAPSSERVSIQEAAARLPELLERVRQGHEIIIAQDDRPMARLTAIAAAETQLQTVIAVRDQVISAYQEILRMPI